MQSILMTCGRDSNTRFLNGTQPEPRPAGVLERSSSRSGTAPTHPGKGWMRMAWALTVTFAVILPAQAATDRPSIVLIMPDDMGYGDLAAHGNPLIRTPHLDALHGESARFTDFQVSPTCAPTRSALMTGRHEFKNGVTHTINERERMSLDAVTLPQVLKQAGYTTGIFGKWHLGDEAPYQPDRRGFDEVYIHGAGGIGQTYPGSCGDFPDNTYFDPALLHNGTVVRTKGYCTDLFFDQALRWMDSCREAGTPFFAYITPNAPHSPLISPGPKYDALYEGKQINGRELKEGDVAYYAMISNIDDNVGKLLSRLDEWRLARDTLVIFLSDNGGTQMQLFNAGMRGSKGTYWRGGTRAPSFWRWPAGNIGGGTDCPALTAHVDILPTLADLLGIPLTGKVKAQVEGRSMAPLLRDPGAEWPDRTLVTHLGRWPRGKATDFKHQRCSIRNSRFRLVENAQLYDLETDPGETTDVANEHPDTVAALRAAYDQWWDDIQPGLVNENVVGPRVNPMKALYWEQLGGGPSEELLKRMDPAKEGY